MENITINLVDPVSKLFGLQKEYIGKICDLLKEMDHAASELRDLKDLELVKIYVRKIEELDQEISVNYEIVKGIEERAKKYAKVP